MAEDGIRIRVVRKFDLERFVAALIAHIYEQEASEARNEPAPQEKLTGTGDV